MEHNFFFIALALWLFLDVLWIFARPAFNLISITGSGKALFSFYLLFITFFFFFSFLLCAQNNSLLSVTLLSFEFDFDARSSSFDSHMKNDLSFGFRCCCYCSASADASADAYCDANCDCNCGDCISYFISSFLLFSNEWMNEWALTHSRSHPICTIRIVVFASVSFFAFLTFFLGLCLVRSRVALKSRKAWAPNATGRFDNAPTNGKKFAMKRNLYGWKAAQSAPAEQSIQRCCCCSYTRNNSLIFWILNQEYFQLGQKAPLSKFLKLKNNEKIKIYMNNNKKGIMYNNSNGGL